MGSNKKTLTNMLFDFTPFYGRIALISDDKEKITYDELDDFVFIIGKIMHKRTLVFSLCTNTIGSVTGYAGFIKSGIVPVMLSAGMDITRLNTLLALYKPQYVWSPENMADSFENREIILEKYGYVLLFDKTLKSYPLYDDLALLLTTSGSTGSPKFVRQSYGNIMANTNSIIKYLEINSFERPITTLPMNYTYGLSIINTHLAVGATILLTDKTLMQKEFWIFFNDFGATSFGGVPYTYEMLYKLRFFRMNHTCLRTMTQAGGKLTPELHEKFACYAKEKGIKFIVMYGQCEATARMGYLPADKAVEKKGSMGIAIPGGKFKLIDDIGTEISQPNMTGELVYEGSNVTLGYAERGEDLIKGDERHGVLKTGDMAKRDEDGFYYIVGRKKRFLKIYGNRVNLDEMDRLIKGKYEIEVTCAGIDDRMYIFITDDCLAGEVKEYVSKTTKLNPSAFKVIVLDDIPKNDSGKILYSELEKYYDIR